MFDFGFRMFDFEFFNVGYFSYIVVNDGEDVVGVCNTHFYLPPRFQRLNVLAKDAE